MMTFTYLGKGTLLGAVAVLILVRPVAAQNAVFTGTNGANWNAAGNWSTGIVPVSGSAVFINNGGTAVLDAAGAGQSIFLGQGTGNGNLQVSSGAVLNASGILIGRDNARVGTLTVSGGSISMNELFVGDGRGDGSGGSGTATISGGAITLSNQFQIGAASNASGTVNMSGGSVISTNLIVGAAGAGTFMQAGGTSSITGTSFLIASNSASNSVMNLSGTAVMHASNATIRVGGSGSGTGGIGLFSGGTLNAAGVVVAANSTFSDLGGVLNVTGGITNSGTWIFSPSNAVTRSYRIVGSGSVTKNGAGLLTLAATNGYTGDTILNAGNIRLGVASALPAATVLKFGANTNSRRLQLQGRNQTVAGVDSTEATGGILIVEAASDNVSNAPATLTLNVAAGRSYDFSGYVRNAAGTATNSALTLVKNGAGTQVFSGSSGFVNYAGTTTINAGVLEFSGANSVAGNSAITLGGGTVRFSGGGTRSNTISGTGNLEKTGANTLTLSGNNSFAGGTLISAGTLQFNDGGSVAGNITNNAALLFNRTDSATVASAISGAGALIKAGAGTVTLDGVNTYTGPTTINAGTLVLGASGSMRFVVGPSGESTAVTGAGNFAARGTFTLDLTGAATNAGASWQMVASASKTFGETFAVAGFTESPAGTWSLATNGVTYQFVENNGALFVANVPPYDMWSRGYGLDPDGDGAPGADPDGDSLPNLREYAFGSNPVMADTESWRISRDGTNLVFSWLQRTDGSVSYTLLEHADLVTGPWLASTAVVEPGSGPMPPAGYQWMQISVPASGKKFFRVQAVMPQRQTITFDALPAKTLGLPPFTLTATASSGLPVSYTSSNPAVATVSGTTVTIVGLGTATITASQAGDEAFSSAADVRQTLTVLEPTSLTVDAKADFGAVGDGITDDTDALQNALDYLSARIVSDGGACLVLPPGTYKITRRLNFEKSTARAGQCQGVTIRGAESRGPDATIIYSAGTEGALFFNVNDDNGHFYQFGVRIQDLQIQAGAADAGAAIEIRRMSAADAIQSVVPLIKNVVITTDTEAKYFRYGIVGRKVVWPHFTDVSVTGVRQGMEACIYLERVYSFTVNNCHLAGAGTGIDARLGGEQNDIMHSIIADVNIGINMQVDPFAPTGPSSLGGAIYGCAISAWDAAVIIDHKGFFVINDNAFVALGEAPNYRHLSLKKVHRTIVSDNTFTGAPNQTGVYLENPFSWGNTIAYNNFGSLATAVQVGSGVETTMILDNLPAAAPVINAGIGTFVRRESPRAFRDTAARYPAYGYESGRVLMPWSKMAHGPVVDVTHYGANGLDTLDDTAAIQSALSAVQAHLDHGGQATLYFPAGLYHLSSRLDLTQAGANWQNLTVCGDGAHVSAIAVTGTQGVFKIDCTQPIPISMHGLRIDPRTANPSTAIEITQQNGTVDGQRSLLLQDVHFFTWDTNGRHFRGAIEGTGVVRPLLQNVEMRSVSTDLAAEFGLRFTGGYGLDWQGGRIYGKQAAGLIESLGGAVNIRGPWFNVGGLSGLTLEANGGSFSWNAAHTDAPFNLRVAHAQDAAVINALTLSGPQNKNPAAGTTLLFENCTDLVVRDNILAAAFQTPRPANVFIQLGASPETCNGFDISGNMMIFNDGEGTGINIPAANLNGTVYDNRFFGNSIADIVCDEPSTTISLLP